MSYPLSDNITLTDESIKEIAIKYCQLIGENPYDKIGHGPPPNESGFVHAILIYSPRWELYIGKVKSALAMQTAIMSVLK